MWRINLIFDNGHEEDSGEEYQTKKEALEEAESYLDTCLPVLMHLNLQVNRMIPEIL